MATPNGNVNVCRNSKAVFSFTFIKRSSIYYRKSYSMVRWHFFVVFLIAMANPCWDLYPMKFGMKMKQTETHVFCTMKQNVVCLKLIPHGIVLFSIAALVIDPVHNIYIHEKLYLITHFKIERNVVSHKISFFCVSSSIPIYFLLTNTKKVDCYHCNAYQ